MYLMFKKYIHISIYIGIFKNVESLALRMKQGHIPASGRINYIKGSNRVLRSMVKCFLPLPLWNSKL